MFTKLAKWVTAHPKKIILFWIVIILASGYFAANLPSILSAGGFNDPKSESMIAKETLQKEFTNKYPQNLIVVIDHKSKKVTDPDYKDIVQAVENKVSGMKYIEEVTSYYSNKNEQFVSKDGLTTYLALGISATEDQAASIVPDLQSEIKKINKEEFQIKVTGGPALLYALNNATKKEVTKAEMIAIPVMIIILLLVFRTVASTVLPLMMALFALGSTMAFVYFIGQQYTLNILITNIISMIGLGVIVDYSLFIISRFRQELRKMSVIDAVRKTMETSGKAVFYSGLTVAISLSALFIPNMMIFNSIALGGVVVVSFAILVSLTMLPAILTVMGERVNWGRLPFYKEKSTFNTWGKLSKRLMKRPVIFLLPALSILIFFAWPSMQTNMQVPVASATVIPKDSPAREGFELLTSKFSQGDIFPIEVVLKSNGESMLKTKNLERVDEITKKIEKLKNVEKVTSITNWNNEWNLSDYENAYKNYDDFPSEITSQLKNLLNKDNDAKSTLILVASSQSADSKATHDLVVKVREKVEQINDNEFTTFVGGETATGVDFDNKVTENIPLIIMFVFIISFVVLVITFKSIVIPIKAIALNTLVTLASLGLLVLVFQNEMSWIFDSNQTINSVTPVVLFAVLFGLSMDYEVIIISRMKELHDSGVSHNESISRGISETAGLVNGAAAIMIAVFGAFALVDIRVVAEIGLGLTFAIIVDALLVRTIFVPILMMLMGKVNWWLPFRKKSANKDTPSNDRISKGGI